jgi:hypothetical protein
MPRNLRGRLDRLARTVGAEDAAGRLVAVIAHGEAHATVRADRWAWSLVVPWSEAVEAGGLDEALAALAPDQRPLIRPQDKVVVLCHPPGSQPPRIESCGL